MQVKAQGTSCLVITHRHELLAMVDSILVMHDGQMAAFGPREQILKALDASRRPAALSAGS